MAVPYPIDPADWIEDQIDRLVPNPPPDPCRSLALIGNGWDLALGCRSSFADFREYFESLSLADLADGDDVLMRIFEQIEEIAGPGWRDFEAGLGSLNLPAGVADPGYADDGDLSELDQLSADGHNYGYEFRSHLSGTFGDWIGQIPAPTLPARPNARALVDTSDALLTFNYTDILQSVFGVDDRRILHIHGRVHGSTPLYFGCAPPTRNRWRATGSNSLTTTVREEALEALLAELTKDPRIGLIDRFLEHADTLSRIGSYGFSFGDADYPYVRHLIDHYCDSGTVWTNHCYSPHGDLADSPDAENFHEALDALGFPGTTKLAST